MNFKDWLLSEAFNLPISVYQDSIPFIIENLKKNSTAKRFNPITKTFKLNLNNTQYEFLNPLNPHLELTLIGKDKDAGFYTGMHTNQNKHIAKITLTLKYYKIIYRTLEHEILHFIQDLIQKYVEKKYKNKPTVGGIPPLPIVKKIMKDKNIDVQGELLPKKIKRIDHPLRPIEYYTNLNSIIKDLQTNFIKSIESNNSNSLGIFSSYLTGKGEPKEINTNWETVKSAIADKTKKKLFLNQNLYQPTQLNTKLEKIKKLDKNLYQIYIREIYKQFVNTDFSSHYDDLLTHLKNNQQPAPNKQTKFDPFKRKFKINNENIWDLLTPDFDTSNVASDNDAFGSTLELIENMLREINIEPNDDGEFNFSGSKSKFKKIFNKIKELRNTTNYTYLRNNDSPLDVTKCLWDNFAQNLAQLIQSHKHNISQSDVLNMFYPKPYQNCPNLYDQE